LLNNILGPYFKLC